MSEISLKEMLEAGVHFGHKTDRWNPKMRSFIFTERNGVHIFDLAQTKEKIEAAQKFAKEIVGNGGTILFVGTKNQTKEVIKDAAERAGMPYLVERWPGGMLTNFKTILERLRYMKKSEAEVAGEENGAAKSNVSLTKKEKLNLSREIGKLKNVFEGVREMDKIPEVVFVSDLVKEGSAVREAKKLGIPVIGIADTNANPDVEYPIPGNDDAVRSVKYIFDKISETIADSAKAKKEAEIATEKDEKLDVDAIEDVEKLEKLEMKAEEEVVVKRQKPAGEKAN